MRALGLDLGTKTLGVAISLSGILANPYKTIFYDGTSYEPLIKELKTIITQIIFTIIRSRGCTRSF